MYKENITPKKIPNKVADVPIIIPTKKNILVIDLFNTPHLDNVERWNLISELIAMRSIEIGFNK